MFTQSILSGMLKGQIFRNKSGVYMLGGCITRLRDQEDWVVIILGGDLLGHQRKRSFLQSGV